MTKEELITLLAPIPDHVELIFTAWADDEGNAPVYPDDLLYISEGQWAADEFMIMLDNRASREFML